MRRMLQRISPVLLASVVAGGFVATSALPATAEGREERRDRLHAERPIAAPALNPSALPMVDFDEIAAIEAAAYGSAIEHALAETAYAAMIVEALSSRRGPAAVARASSRCNGDVACFLECTRAIESTDDYGAVSRSGTYRGAYQFHQRTWDAAVAGAGHGEYSGMPAEQAPPEVQDAAAAHLYSVSGNRPWGGRC